MAIRHRSFGFLVVIVVLIGIANGCNNTQTGVTKAAKANAPEETGQADTAAAADVATAADNLP